MNKWSAGDVIALKYMWRVAGMSSSQIAQITKRTRDSVIGKVHRLKMSNEGRWAPGGGKPRWAPFQNPRYRPEDDPTYQKSRQDNYIPVGKILPLPGCSTQA